MLRDRLTMSSAIVSVFMITISLGLVACGPSKCETEFDRVAVRAEQELEKVLGDVEFARVGERCEYEGEAIFYFHVDGWIDGREVEDALIASPGWSYERLEGTTFTSDDVLFTVSAKPVEGNVEVRIGASW